MKTTLFKDDWAAVLKSDLDQLTGMFEMRESAAVRLKEGERRNVTILFLDIKGFTSMSEKLDPEDVQSIIDKCFKVLTNEIERYGGFIDKYEGDRIMALFGSRQATETDCQHALFAALGMQEKFAQINDYLKRQNIEIGIRIGVNSGLVVTGKIGKEREQDFTVMGDAVNLAARLETAAPVGGIMISDETRQAAGDTFIYKELAPITVKGKSEPIKVYTVHGVNPEGGERWEKRHDRRTQFVGRESELQILQRIHKSLAELSGRNVACTGIRGAAGVGKTRLLYEFLAPFAVANNQTKAVVLRGDTPSVFRPYGLVTSLLTRLFGFPPQAKTDEATLLKSLQLVSDRAEALLPPVALLFNERVTDKRLNELNPKALQLEIMLAVRRLFDDYCLHLKNSGTRLLLLRLEDVHRADSHSQEALEFLLQQGKFALPTHLLMTYRAEHIVPTGIGDWGAFTEISLTPLNAAETRSYCAKALGIPELHPELEQLILQKSGGNPLFVEELLQALIHEKVFVQHDGAWEFIAANFNPEMPIPDSIQRLILARIDHLAREEKQTLQLASVLGEECDFAHMQTVELRLGRDAARFNACVSELVRRNFLVEGSKGLAFKSPFIREVAYATLLNQNKEILHRLVGESIEQQELTLGETKDPHILADHFALAGDAERSIRYSLVALERFTRQFLTGDSLRIADRAIDIAERTAQDTSLFELLYYKVQILHTLGRRESQESCLQRMEKMASNDSMRARVAHHWSRYYYDIGKYEPAVSAAERGLQLAQAIGNQWLVMECYRVLGDIQQRRLQHRDSLTHYEASLKLAVAGGFRFIEGELHNAMGLIFFQHGDYDKAQQLLERSQTVLEELREVRGLASCLCNLGLVYLKTQRYAPAEQLFQRSLELFRTIGWRKGEGTVLGNLGVLYAEQGVYPRAITYYGESLNIKRSISDLHGECYDRTNLGVTHGKAGDLAAARRFHDEALQLTRQLGLTPLVGENLLGLAQILEHQGGAERFHEAMSLLDEAIGLQAARDDAKLLSRIRALKSLLLLRLGKDDEALAESKRYIDVVLAKPALSSGDEFEIAYNGYLVQREIGTPQTTEQLLFKLHAWLQRCAQNIVDAPMRQRFLDGPEPHRTVLHAWGERSQSR